MLINMLINMLVKRIKQAAFFSINYILKNRTKPALQTIKDSSYGLSYYQDRNYYINIVQLILINID